MHTLYALGLVFMTAPGSCPSPSLVTAFGSDYDNKRWWRRRWWWISVVVSIVISVVSVIDWIIVLP